MHTEPHQTDSDIVEVFHFEHFERNNISMSHTRLGEVGLSLETIPVGEKMGDHYHSDTRMTLFASQGKIEALFEDIVTKKRSIIILEPGGMVIHNRERVAHRFTNIGEDPATLVIISSKRTPHRDAVAYQFEL